LFEGPYLAVFDCLGDAVADEEAGECGLGFACVCGELGKLVGLGVG
jgi:hypothetical protein